MNIQSQILSHPSEYSGRGLLQVCISIHLSARLSSNPVACLRIFDTLLADGMPKSTSG